MRSTLPWIFILILIAGGGLLFSANQRQAADIVRLEQVARENKANTAGSEANSTANDPARVEQVRKDHEELLRLRNDVRQLREDNRRLISDLQKSQQTAANHQQQLEARTAEMQQLKARANEDTARQQNAQITAACVNNLRLIDSAKQQWALESNRPAQAVPTPQDLLGYLPNKAFPTCPAGGVYNMNPLSQPPTCSTPGHSLLRGG
jgi:hypothetical protein